jgi:tRNA threonylcarbamoyladenosine biosynthesis protein TsaB
MPAPTKLLAFDTSTEWLSVARLVSRAGPGGAHASGGLIPLIQELLTEAGLALAELDAIAFGRGPGSFTGLRTACSVAQGLGFGAGVPLLPVDTLHAVAEEARHRFGATRVVALLDARMDELYAAHYDFEQPALGDAEPRLLAPEQVQVPPGWALAGNVFSAYGDRLPAAAARHEALPGAEAMLRLAPELLAAGRAVAPAQAWPLYVRDKVAQTTQERAALKAAQASRSS